MNSSEARSQTIEKAQKRPGGQRHFDRKRFAAGENPWCWKIESELREGTGGPTHRCGTKIEEVEVPFKRDPSLPLLNEERNVRKIKVPFCPSCEEEPFSGVHRPEEKDPGIRLEITEWKEAK